MSIFSIGECDSLVEAQTKESFADIAWENDGITDTQLVTLTDSIRTEDASCSKIEG